MMITKVKNSIAHTYFRHIWGYLYICTLMVCLSFYFANGYLDMGEDKYRIFMYVSCVGLPVWIFLYIVESLRDYVLEHKEKGTGFIEYAGEKSGNCTSMDFFIGAYALAAVISTLTSNYRTYSIWGCGGWHMGMVVQLLMAGVYVISRDVAGNVKARWFGYLTGLLFATASLVFLLGILNRFSIFPIHMFGQREEFISTLGNINWYCGYWCIWFGLGCGIFLMTGNRRVRYAAGLFVWFASVAGVSCGATSAYLAWMAVVYVSFLVCLADTGRLIRWAVMLILQLLSLPTLRFIGVYRVYRMWYDSAWLKEVCFGTKWILPFGIGLAFCLSVIFICKIRPGSFIRLRWPLVAASVGGILALIVIIVLNTVIEGGIWPVRGMSMFTWTKAWGNGRGGIWSTTVMMIKDMNPYLMLFGAGCDCYYPYCYFTSDLSWQFLRIMGNQYLTNAHNELLTMFVNEGIFGLTAYVGLLISHAVYGLKNAVPGRYCLGFVLACGAYVAVGLVGFMQILATPFLFMMLGMIAADRSGSGLMLDK